VQKPDLCLWRKADIETKANSRASYCVPLSGWGGGHGRPTKCEKNYASYKKDSKYDEGKQSAPCFSFCVRSQGQAVAAHHFSWNA
jgi:hypothetical protein